MKKIYMLLCSALFALISNAQNPVPNPSFENWSNGKPTDWSNSYAPVTQVSPGNTGSYAVKTGATGQLSVGSGNGFTIAQDYHYLNFWYKFNKISTEHINISVELDNNIDVAVGLANTSVSNAASSFTAVSIPITNTGSGAVSCTIDMFLAAQGQVPDSSYFIVDDVSLTSSPLGIVPIQKQALNLQVFPNPATGTVHINFDAHGQKTNTVQITDITGRMVKELITTDSNLTIDISALAPGNYIVAIRNDEMLLTKKLVIQ